MLDGLGAFNGMGIIACTSPGAKVNIPIPRTNITPSELSEIGEISLKYFKLPNSPSEESTYFLELGNNNESVATDSDDTKFDLFSKLIWPLKETRPN